MDVNDRSAQIVCLVARVSHHHAPNHLVTIRIENEGHSLHGSTATGSHGTWIGLTSLEGTEMKDQVLNAIFGVEKKGGDIAEVKKGTAEEIASTKEMKVRFRGIVNWKQADPCWPHI